MRHRRIVLEVESRIPQQRSVWTETKPYVLFLGGVGASKTYTSVVWQLTRPAGSHILTVAPTVKNLQSGVLAQLLPLAFSCGLVEPNGYKKQDGELHLVDGKRIFIRSLDRPELIRGANVDFLAGDELGIIPRVETWNILIARVRRGHCPPQHLVTTTPPPTGELHWLYDEFVRNADPAETAVYSAKSEDNPYLPEGFTERLRKRYAEGYALRELDAQWINVGSVEVYDVDQMLTIPIPPARVTQTIRAWDVAATGGGGDYTAGCLMSVDEAGQLYIRDMVRGQWAPHQRDAIIRRTAEADGQDVPVWLPEARGDAGKGQSDTWRRKLVGFRVKCVLESGDKVIRAGPLAGHVGHGQVSLTSEPGRWETYYNDNKLLSPDAARSQLRRNLGLFPQAREKDESDAAALALRAHTEQHGPAKIGAVGGARPRASDRALFPRHQRRGALYKTKR